MPDKAELADVIDAERRRHPGMDGRDLQKLIYQSVFGGDHLLVDRRRFAGALRAEWVRLETEDPASAEPPLQSIDPEGKTARLHLAACRRRGIDLDLLAELLVRQSRKNGRRTDYERRWIKAIELAEAGRIPFSARELAEIGYPQSAPHHSPGYGAAAYRIVNDASDPVMVRRLHRLGVW